MINAILLSLSKNHYWNNKKQSDVPLTNLKKKVFLRCFRKNIEKYIQNSEFMSVLSR